MLQFLLFLSALAFLAGFLAVAWVMSWFQAGGLIGGELRAAPSWPRVGCPQAASQAMSLPSPAKHDHRLTGAAIIDAQLKQALQYGMRDFVQSWFHVWVSADTAFPEDVQRMAQTVVQELANRCKQADLVTLLSQTLLEECLSHVTHYNEACRGSEGSVESCVFASLPSDDPWSAVCQQPEAQQAYLQGMSEVLLYLVLPEEDFHNAALRHLMRDVLTQQVWIPLLQLLSRPDFINTTLISLCKDSALNAETFLAAVRSSQSPAEVGQLQKVVVREVERLKKRGVSGTDKQKLASLEVVRETIQNQLDGHQDDTLEETESSLPLSLSVSVPRYVVQRGKHVAYEVSVECRHLQVEVVENWTTLRHFSDFHDLHITLRTMLGSLPPSLGLPSQRALKKLEPTFLDGRRRGLEQYLQTVVSEQFLARSPQALPQVVLFLSDSVYKRSSNELDRQVDRLVHPFRRHTVSSTRLESSVKAVPSPSLLRRQRVTTDSREGSSEEEEDMDLLMALLDEIFDLRKQGQWLRRQLAHMLRQLIGDRVSRKMVDTVEWLTSPEQVAEYCRDLTNTLWPGGFRPTYQERRKGGEEEEEEQEEEEGLEALRCLLARAKLIGSLPDDLRRVLGSRPTTQGMARLSHLLQEPSLNCWLVLRLLEAALEALFPSQGVRSTLCSLRCELSAPRAQ